VAFLIVAGQIVTSVFAAYAFAFLEFPFRRTLFIVFLSTLMIPFEVTFFTNVQTVSTFKHWPIIGSIAGYAFAFLEFPLKRTLFLVFLATLMVPFEITIVTNLSTINSLGWYNSYQGLAVPFLATGFGAFLMRQAFLQVPRDLQDAASLDGYGHWRFMTRVAVPLARPAIAALAVFGFLGAWNQYLWPLLATRDDRLRTVQIGLKHLRDTQLNDFGVTFAGTVIAVLPIVILLLAFQKHLVRGLTAGAVKG
ncbi:MAG: carbohydrate ABC transporter permease, partial [Acidimicrobiia bacterium]